MRQLIIVCILVARALAFAQPPRLQPRVILPGEQVGSFWLLAPDIAVITVNDAERLGPDIEVTPPRKLVLHLVAVDAIVENVIQGDLAKGPVRFYFFTNTLVPNIGYTTPLSWFEPGKRYAVFLREDGGVLRTMADLTEPNIRIRSGYHDALPLPSSRPSRRDPGTVIASVALTPSGGYEKGFANSIEDTFGRVLLVSTPGRIAPLLRQLLVHPDKEIRERACLSLSINFSYGDPCLPKLLASDDPAVKQQANIWAIRKRLGAQRLVRMLEEDPIALSASGKVDDLASDLEQYTFDSDRVVRQGACNALRRLFPSGEFLNCATAHPNDK